MLASTCKYMQAEANIDMPIYSKGHLHNIYVYIYRIFTYIYIYVIYVHVSVARKGHKCI